MNPDFNGACALLRGQYEELAKTDLDSRYDRLLMRTEDDWSKFDLAMPGTEETQPKDLSIVPIDFTHPDTGALQQLNRNVFAASFRRHMTAREFSFATRLLASWRSLAKDVQTLYSNAYDSILRSPGGSGLKNEAERKAYINGAMPEIVQLKSDVEKFYDKEGNVIGGEIVYYRNALQMAIENYDAQLASDNKHLDVFQKMKDLGM